MVYIYPDISDEKFYQRINNKYKKYYISKKKKSFKSICFPKEFNLQIQQKFLAEYINPKSPYKGILIFHRIGAGKTCTVINICEKWKKIRKIIVVVPASLVGNFKSELRSLCAGNAYLTNNERNKLKTLHPSTNEYKEIIMKSNKRIAKYYNIYSYNKFVCLAENNKINLRNSVLVVDEIQNMVSETGKHYQVLYDTIHNAPQSLRIILLSATPMFDKPIEIALTMNLLRIPFEFPTNKIFEKMFIKKIENKRTGKIYYSAKNLDIFKERIKGYISYFRGAPPYVFPESTIRYVNCIMDDFQYKSYLTVLKTETKKINNPGIRTFRKGGILKLPNDFFIGSRIISNIAYPNKSINEDGLDSLYGKCLELHNLKKYSTKFVNILKKIKRAWGPIFVYSNFKEYGGVRSFIKVLKAYGYLDYTKYGEGRKRFALWTGDEKSEIRDEIKDVYNQASNYNGSKLKIIVASPSIKEGVSLLRCQQVHILEPYWNWNRMAQVIGRAIRYCSHKDLPEEKRRVKVYIYLAIHPNEKETVDQYIMRLALKKNKIINQFEIAMKEAAIDCSLFKNANVFKGENNINCEI